MLAKYDTSYLPKAQNMYSVSSVHLRSVSLQLSRRGKKIGH